MEPEPVVGLDDEPIRFLDVEGWSDYRIGDDGSIWRWRHGRWRRLSPRSIDGKPAMLNMVQHEQRRRASVAALILEAFVGKRPTPRHWAVCLDGNHENLRPDNLAWLTAAEVADLNRRLGKFLDGSKHPKAKLTEDKVADIRRRLLAGERHATLAEQFGVSEWLLWLIAQGRVWKHVAI